MFNITSYCCSLNRVWLSETPWTAACQASLSFAISRSFLKLMSAESVTTSNHLILCHPLLHLPSIFPSIRVFSNESVLRIRWPRYWSFSFSVSPSKWIFRVDFLYSLIQKLSHWRDSKGDWAEGAWELGGNSVWTVSWRNFSSRK